METYIHGILKSIVTQDEEPIGFVLETDHLHEIPSRPSFLGDDHYREELEKISLYFTCTESFIGIVKHASLGDRMTVTFVLRGIKQYDLGWSNVLIPRIIKNQDATELLYSRTETRGKV